MDHQRKNALELASFLKQHQQTLAIAWAKEVYRHASIIPRDEWLEDITQTTTRALAAIITLLTTDSYADMEYYLADLCQEGIGIGFEIGEVTQGILLCKNAVMPQLRQAKAQDAQQLWAMADVLDDCLRWMLQYISNLYASNITARLRNQNERTTLMLKLGQTSPDTLDVHQLLTHVVEAMIESVDVLHCRIFLVHKNQAQIIANVGVSRPPLAASAFDNFLNQQRTLPLDMFLQQAIETKEPVVSYNAQTDPRMSAAIKQDFGTKSALAVPLVAHDEVLAIAVAATYSDYRAFTEEQIELARDVVRAAALVIENARLYEKWQQENQSIQRVITALLQEFDLEEILNTVCTETQHLTGAPVASVYFLEEDNWLHYAFSAGDMPPNMRVPAAEPFTGQALHTGKAMLNNAFTIDAPHNNMVTPQNLLVAPMIANETRLGVLFAANKPFGFTDNDIRIASILANHAAIAIEKARLHQQLQHMAAIEERERLAREIHDNLAQGLSVLKLYASNANDLLIAGQIEQTNACLTQMTRTATELHIDAREAIFNLRNGREALAEFLPALQTQIDRFRQTCSIAVELDLPPDDSFVLAEEIVIQLTRIIQEALTNIRKHAQASHVTLQLQKNHDHLTVIIEDDGLGFDTTLVSRDPSCGVGLRIMQERIESLAGVLVIDTQPQQGTRIIARIPIANRS